MESSLHSSLHTVLGIPPFGEQNAMQSILLNVPNGDCELVIKLVAQPVPYLWPGRSTARSLCRRWALRLPLLRHQERRVGHCQGHCRGPWCHLEQGHVRSFGHQFTIQGLGPRPLLALVGWSVKSLFN